MQAAFSYGHWQGRRLDNRSAVDSCDLPVGFPLEEAAAFNQGNPLTSVIGPQGFLVFENAPHLTVILYAYYEDARSFSCGRCTPCRMGTVLIAEALKNAVEGRGSTVDWDEIAETARHMKVSSLCGIGLQSAEPILGAIENFRAELETTEPVAGLQGLKDAKQYVSTATAPCIEACPAHVNVPRYIDYIRDGRPEMAEGVLLKRYPLVGTCGRVCVRPCEAACARRFNEQPIAIRDLKRHAADELGVGSAELFDDAMLKHPAPGVDPNQRIAVIGAGPAGIVCAYHLLRLGRPVDVFEMEQEAGGMARWGIPSYRLPRAELAGETDIVKTLGGHYRYGEKLGRDFHLNDLFAQGYDAVFLGIGCARGQFLGLPDEDQNAQGYLRGLDCLLEVEHSQGTPEGPKPLEGDVVVIGCGNVAMDCCRTARRIVKPGCQVTVAYRRIEASAPADPEEIHAARAEGIRFEFLSAPKRILVENGRVVGIELVRMHQTEPDASGRRAVKPLPGSEFIIPCSYVIAAIGQKMDPTVFIPEDGIALTRWGTIETKENFTTSREGVFAGGDAATGPKTLILAMAQGEAAAKSIDQYLKTREPAFFPRTRLSQIIAKAKLVGACRPTRPLPIEARYTSKFLDPEARSANWEEVEGAMTIEEARQESQRCMRCMRLIAVTTRNPVVEHEPTAPNAATF